MDNGPLVKEEIEAGALLAQEFNRYAPLKAAFWLRASDEEQRYLYLSSDAIDDSNFDLAYGEVGRILKILWLPDLDFFRIKVLSGADPLADAAASLATRYPDSAGRRFGSRPFGDSFVGDGYVYPQPLPVAA